MLRGQAVETYTAGQFTTGDVDITTTDREATEELLASMGFERAGVVWLWGTLGRRLVGAIRGSCVSNPG